jgi:8-oxo-dGTP diphosphatase
MQKNDIKGERHAAIVIKEGQVLLIHRFKNNYEYYVFPGGHRETNEDGADTAVRETKEETEISIKAKELAFKFQDNFLNKTDFYYLCSWEEGENPHLGGEEKIKNCPENFYEPMWVSLDMIENLNILPQFAKFWLLENLTILCSKNCS